MCGNSTPWRKVDGVVVAEATYAAMIMERAAPV